MQERRKGDGVLLVSVDDLVLQPYYLPQQSILWRKRRRLHRETHAATSPVEAGVEDEADDIDDLSSEEETVMGFGGGSSQRKRLVFPKEEEL